MGGPSEENSPEYFIPRRDGRVGEGGTSKTIQSPRCRKGRRKTKGGCINRYSKDKRAGCFSCISHLRTRAKSERKGQRVKLCRGKTRDKKKERRISDRTPENRVAEHSNLNLHFTMKTHQKRKEGKRSNLVGADGYRWEDGGPGSAWSTIINP